MTRCRLQISLFARATAWFLLLFCGWMGTGGVLCHSDAEAGVASHIRPVVHHAAAAVPPHSCAACRWTQGVQTGTLAVCRVQLPLFSLSPRLELPVRRLSPRLVRLRPSRAPPVFLNNC